MGWKCVERFTHTSHFSILQPSLPPYYAASASKNKNVAFTLKSKLDDEYEPLLKSALNAASLRLQETHQSEPLFVDPYAGCFVPPRTRLDLMKTSESDHYCLATKFIDDKLIHTANNIDGLKQVVLLTDGMDTRPYRLSWGSSTIIFDISPETTFQIAAQKLQDVGAKIPRGCLFFHVPLESSDIQKSLCSKGFNGSRPSVWAVQGLPLMNLANFENILFAVSSLAAKGSIFVGEIPAWFAETEIELKLSTQKWMEKLFSGHGLRVDLISYSEVARSLGRELTPGDYRNILFVAEQLRFSDDQMETWRREFQRVEEEGDEQGFEEL
ncbi:hypothetical protein ACFE04_019928 [Oxalis oulophora]